VLRGLRDGVVTTGWPAKPDPYARSWRGPATIAAVGSDSTAELAALCPTGAIGTGSDRRLALDQGKCILCGRCVRERPEVFRWSAGSEAAALTRASVVVPQTAPTQDELSAVRAALAAKTTALRRSVHLRHVDAGSDGAEEQEIAALLNPVYDIHRLGIFFTASPRHADVLLVTGAGSHGMAEPLRRTYAGMPDPKIVVAVGTDAVSGGLLASHQPAHQPAGRQPADGGSYATSAGVAAVIPVDVWVPGSPPPPFAILHALLLAVGRLPSGPRRGGEQR
jgi:Ni,Fe-hydrogenase III small subunit/ferredoxin